MALIKFGMMMTDARGKLGGHVFTKARNGATIRTKVSPANPQTSAQSLSRSIFCNSLQHMADFGRVRKSSMERCS